MFAGCQRAEPGTYATPEEAIQAAHDLIGPADDREIEEIFGPGSADLFRSGDPASDRKAADRVKELIAEKIAFEEIDENTKVALFGNEGVAIPDPARHATASAGASTPQPAGKSCSTGASATTSCRLSPRFTSSSTRSSSTLPRSATGMPLAFAQQFISTEGKQDGLYWPTAEGEPLSPLGDLLAAAALEKIRSPAAAAVQRLPLSDPQSPGPERARG